MSRFGKTVVKVSNECMFMEDDSWGIDIFGGILYRRYNWPDSLALINVHKNIIVTGDRLIFLKKGI